MHNNTTFPFINIGSSSLLVIFLALCLSTFSVLAVSSARSDYTFSKKAADQRLAYYEASNTAEEMLADLDVWIQAARIDSFAVSSTKGFTFALAARLDNEYTYDTVNQLIFFSVPMTDTRILSVTVRVEPRESVRRYTVTRWSAENTADWSADDTMELYRP